LLLVITVSKAASQAIPAFYKAKWSASSTELQPSGRCKFKSLGRKKYTL